MFCVWDRSAPTHMETRDAIGPTTAARIFGAYLLAKRLHDSTEIGGPPVAVTVVAAAADGTQVTVINVALTLTSKDISHAT